MYNKIIFSKNIENLDQKLTEDFFDSTQNQNSQKKKW